MRTFSQNDRQLQGIPGAIAVLHTNTRTLDYHPHVHLVMPAAALDPEDRQWRTKRRGKTEAGYLFNHKALAKVFRATMLAGIEAAGLGLPARYPSQWVAHCKSVGAGRPALIYLGRYLYRGVIRYRNAKTGRFEHRTMPGADFLWLILQHLLPKGFRRARNCGFLHPYCKRLIAPLHLLLRFDPDRATGWVKQRAPILCACCGAAMTIMRTRIRSTPWQPVTTPIPTPGTC